MTHMGIDYTAHMGMDSMMHSGIDSMTHMGIHFLFYPIINNKTEYLSNQVFVSIGSE